jgi:prophage regulatory protein
MLKDQSKSIEPVTATGVHPTPPADAIILSTPRYINPNYRSNFVRPRDLPLLTGLSRTTIWRLESSGEFPKRVRLSAGAVGYRMLEVLEWCASRQVVESRS